MASRFEELFSAVRDIPASEAAAHLNITLNKRGNRSIALCPFHKEDTPSLTFYPDGHFYCFGCHEHGGSIELYQKILNIAPLSAARALAEDFNIREPEQNIATGASSSPRKKPSAYDLKRTLEQFRVNHWRSLRDRKYSFISQADEIAVKIGNPEICADSDAFWEAVQGAAKIEDELFLLEDASAAELLKMAGGTDEHP